MENKFENKINEIRIQMNLHFLSSTEEDITMVRITKDIAECVGLWLAEGDTKTIREITFTNNCFSLVEHFHKTLKKVFKDHRFNLRVYVYSKGGQNPRIPLENIQVNYYTDNRATKPYFIWRLASRSILRLWKGIVEQASLNETTYCDLLRGFFAGEGNIKVSSHASRVVRITQSKEVPVITKILKYYRIYYKFIINHRNGYVIQRKENFDKLAKYRIPDLHPIRKKKFYDMLRGYKYPSISYYPKFYLRNTLLELFDNGSYYTTEQLSDVFGRTTARIYDELSNLKKEKIIKNYKVGSKTYWILNKLNTILISKRKHQYIKILVTGGKRKVDIANSAGVCFKSASNRLRELEELGLVERTKDNLWKLSNIDIQVVVV